MSTHTEDTKEMTEFYSTKGIPEELKQTISFMRQWLNEDRKATPQVTARDLWHWLEKALPTYASQVREKRDREIVEELVKMHREWSPMPHNELRIQGYNKALKEIITTITPKT